MQPKPKKSWTKTTKSERRRASPLPRWNDSGFSPHSGLEFGHSSSSACKTPSPGESWLIKENKRIQTVNKCEVRAKVAVDWELHQVIISSHGCCMDVVFDVLNQATRYLLEWSSPHSPECPQHGLSPEIAHSRLYMFFSTQIKWMVHDDSACCKKNTLLSTNQNPSKSSSVDAHELSIPPLKLIKVNGAAAILIHLTDRFLLVLLTSSWGEKCVDFWGMFFSKGKKNHEMKNYSMSEKPLVKRIHVENMFWASVGSWTFCVLWCSIWPLFPDGSLLPRWSFASAELCSMIILISDQSMFLSLYIILQFQTHTVTPSCVFSSIFFYSLVMVLSTLAVGIYAVFCGSTCSMHSLY